MDKSRIESASPDGPQFTLMEESEGVSSAWHFLVLLFASSAENKD